MSVKTIGLLGGMSWESTAMYYRLLNEMVRDHLGGLHSAKILMDSYDFADIVSKQQSGDWDGAARVMTASAQRLEQSGAECLLICTNTMHILADTIQRSITIPLLHIVDVVAEAAVRQGITTLALLGTRYTMEQPFYKDRFVRYGIRTVVPDAAEQDVIHQVIFNELCQGVVRDESRDRYIQIISHLLRGGAEGVILGCTEIPLLIQSEHVSAPLFDSTYLHAKKAVDIALQIHEPA